MYYPILQNSFSSFTIEDIPFHSFSPLSFDKSVVFFSPDIHDGTRIDLVSSLLSLNQSLVLYSRKANLPPYFKHNYTISNTVDHLQKRQLVIPKTPIPDYKPPVLISTESYINSTFDKVVSNPVFSHVDCVVCMFYPSGCQYFIPFNKTILFLPAHRFSLKRCRVSELRKLVYWMFSYPDHIITFAGGVYDQEYIYYFTGKRVPILYSSSLFTIPEPKEYNPIFDEILVAPLNLKGVKFGDKILTACQNRGLNITLTTVLKIGKHWTLDDLKKFKAVIVFPYAVLSYFLNDLFALAIPMFVPSPVFLRQLGLIHDYCNADFHYCPYSRSLPRHPTVDHAFSPEDGTSKARIYWYQFASFYTPASTQFDSWDDLARKLETTNLRGKFYQRRKENRIMKAHNTRLWHSIISRVQKRNTPSSYKDALQYFNVSSIFSNICNNLY